MSRQVAKEERTLDKYLDIAALWTIVKTLAPTTGSSAVLPAKKQGFYRRVFNDLSECAFKVEDQMFLDFPELDDSYLQAFHLGFSKRYGTDVEKEVRKRMKKYFQKCLEKFDDIDEE